MAPGPTGPTAALELLAAAVTVHRGGTTAHRGAAEVADPMEAVAIVAVAIVAVVTTEAAATADAEW